MASIKPRLIFKSRTFYVDKPDWQELLEFASEAYKTGNLLKPTPDLARSLLGTALEHVCVTRVRASTVPAGVRKDAFGHIKGPLYEVKSMASIVHAVCTMQDDVGLYLMMAPDGQEMVLPYFLFDWTAHGARA